MSPLAEPEMHDCHELARCVNLFGGYACQVRDTDREAIFKMILHFNSFIHICAFFSAARATATATLKTRTAADGSVRAAPRTFATAGGNARYRLEFLDVIFPIFKSY